MLLQRAPGPDLLFTVSRCLQRRRLGLPQGVRAYWYPARSGRRQPCPGPARPSSAHGLSDTLLAGCRGAEVEGRPGSRGSGLLCAHCLSSLDAFSNHQSSSQRGVRMGDCDDGCSRCTRVAGVSRPRPPACWAPRAPWRLRRWIRKQGVTWDAASISSEPACLL